MPPKAKMLSQDELRAKLYQTFKDRGLLDALKTQLRRQLVQELMHPAPRGERPPQSASLAGGPLLVGAANSLVADHLGKCGYEYSLSVFFPESGLAKEKVDTMEDLLQLVSIHPESRLYKSLASGFDKENRRGFLLEFLRHVAASHQPRETCDVGTQTGPGRTSPSKDSLAEKLQLIDEEFAETCPRRLKLESLEMKLNEYKREIEQQLQAEMHQKLKYLKNTEVAKLFLEEKRKYEKELAEFRAQVERTRRAESEALLSREKTTLERIQRHQEMETKDLYAQRQLLLKDIDLLRGREAELRQRIEAFETAQKLHEENHRSAAEALRRRELHVRSMEESYDQKLRSEVLRHQLELQDAYLSRVGRLAEDERKNAEKALHLQEELTAVNSKKEQLIESVNRVKELELQVEAARAQCAAGARQNRALREKLAAARDGARLRDGALRLRAEHAALGQQLEEAQRENRRLLARLAQPPPELAAFRRELQGAEAAAAAERAEFEAQRQALHAQLQAEAERSARLQAQVLGYEATVRRLSAQLAGLKQQLRETQTALENEVARDPKRSLLPRAVPGLLAPRDADVAGDFLPTLGEEEPMAGTATPGATGDPHWSSDGSSPDSGLEFVAGTRARAKELAREAACLDRAFRGHQRRVATRPAARSPPAPHVLGAPRSGPPTASESTSAEAGATAPADTAASRPRRDACRRPAAAPLAEAPRGPDGQAHLEGLGRAPAAATSPRPDAAPRPSPTESGRSLPGHSLSGSPQHEAGVHQRHTGLHDRSDFSNPDRRPSKDGEDPESSSEHAGDAAEPWEVDGLHPAGDMPPPDSAAAAASTPVSCHRPGVDEKRAEKRAAEDGEGGGGEGGGEAREPREPDRERRLIEASLKMEMEKEFEVSTKDQSAGAENPLEKYMRLIQDARGAVDKSPESSREDSRVDTLPPSDKDASFTGPSREEPEDSW